MVGGEGRATVSDYLRLIRVKQWSKSVFVLIGPGYGGALLSGTGWAATIGAVVAFCLASSACYVLNDVRDAEADRAHPRKRHRPVAAGRIGVGKAWGISGMCLAGAGVSLALMPGERMGLVGVCVGLYVLNVVAYSLGVKRVVMLDVMSLASGFVLRVLGGCAAAGVEPSSWLLNCTFFVSMFLAFGKRLGEKRTMGPEAASVRGVLRTYTDELLRMVVVVTGVAALVTYAGYVQAQSDRYTLGFNLLWLTMLPATYALLRSIVLLETGAYDDPTELASADRPFQIGAVVFAAMTGALMWRFPGM